MHCRNGATLRMNHRAKWYGRALALALLICATAPWARGDGVMVDTKRKPDEAKWQPRETMTLEHLTGFTARQDIPAGKFGGRTDRKADVSGFFHPRQIDGRWWLVDPEGLLMYDVGCCSVARSPTRRGDAAMKQKFGSAEKWAAATAGQLHYAGFNALGCWSGWESFKETSPRQSYTVILNFMGGYGKQKGVAKQGSGHLLYPGDCMPVFDPEFEAFCVKLAREKASPLKDDPWLFGYFSDNELPFKVTALDEYLKLPATDPGHQAAARWVEKNGGKADGGAFLEHVADTYFGTVARALRQADPNHLFLGSRLHGSDLKREGIWRAAGRHADVIAVNYYGAWTPDAKLMSQWVEWSHRPFIVTEWYAKGADSGMANTGGAGWLVKTQADRGRFYQNFTLGLLEHPGCVGWHWFKYMDNDPEATGADPSNRDSNKGIVDADYKTYPDLLSRMKEINTRVYPLIDFMDHRRAAK